MPPSCRKISRAIRTSHPETALKSPAVWQSWAAWSKKFVRPSRSYAEHIFCENCPRLANPARVGVRFLDVMSIRSSSLPPIRTISPLDNFISNGVNSQPSTQIFLHLQLVSFLWVFQKISSPQ